MVLFPEFAVMATYNKFTEENIKIVCIEFLEEYGRS
jgi:hypothetical protein